MGKGVVGWLGIVGARGVVREEWVGKVGEERLRSLEEEGGGGGGGL